MSYQFERGESLDEAIRRVAREQIDEGTAEIEDETLDPHKTVHQVRKRCKKLRGLLRLVRPRMPEAFKVENVWYREAARLLSYVRDAQSIIETHDKLVERYRTEIDQGRFTPIRDQLVQRRKTIARDEVGLAERIEEFRALIKQGRERIGAWSLEEPGFGLVAAGLRKTYKRGRKAMAKAYQTKRAEDFHDWRKRVKYHWYHLRLFQAAWSPVMAPFEEAADQLSEYLGDDHDLSILRATVRGDPDLFGGTEEVGDFVFLIDRRREELRLAARLTGSRLFADTPSCFVNRIKRYWSVAASESSMD